jgi:hypothetical protein
LLDEAPYLLDYMPPAAIANHGIICSMMPSEPEASAAKRRKFADQADGDQPAEFEDDKPEDDEFEDDMLDGGDGGDDDDGGDGDSGASADM